MVFLWDIPYPWDWEKDDLDLCTEKNQSLQKWALQILEYMENHTNPTVKQCYLLSENESMNAFQFNRLVCIFEMCQIMTKRTHSALVSPNVFWHRLYVLPLLRPERAPGTPGPMGMHRGSFRQMEANPSVGLLPDIRYGTIRCWPTERACRREHSEGV